MVIMTVLSLSLTNVQGQQEQSLNDGTWLKGDLHVHSRHSKESTNHEVSKILDYAKSVGFGFIAITDHDNHVSGDVAHHTWADPDFKSEDSLLVLYGAEWTTTRGHGNTFSAKPYDHQRLYNVRDLRDTVIGRVKNELGIHLSANHPSGKDHFGYSFDIINSIEVWNSADWSKNVNAIMIWDDMLSSGRKLTGRGGSDAHHGFFSANDSITMEGARSRFSYIGTPTTWVYAKSNSAQSVIDAITNGSVSISANPYAPRVEFYADLNADGKMDVMMGDNTKAPQKPVSFKVRLVGVDKKNSSYTITVIKNGSKFGTYQLQEDSPIVEFTDSPDPSERTFYRVTVEGPITSYPQVPGSMGMSGNMVALSNPIYFNFNPQF
ncbi:CehA/McbA family metallohydrolase [Maribacter sp. X9]|uniref:CehA/McbA family metallohydrolase n=1 Tax=Maribacter sp. X9 TaxID=3402159 RepID=UPI003AF384DE